MQDRPRRFSRVDAAESTTLLQYPQNPRWRSSRCAEGTDQAPCRSAKIASELRDDLAAGSGAESIGDAMTEAERKNEIGNARKLLDELEAMLHYQIVKAKRIRQHLE